MIPNVAIIGGTGLTSLENLRLTSCKDYHTPYGDPSSPIIQGELGGKPVVFLARHGTYHTIPPHKINYRANLWILHHIGIKKIIAVAAVGGIRNDMMPGILAFPDQLIDYTWGRHCTFSDGDTTHVTHVDFTEPYCHKLRCWMVQAALLSNLDIRESCTYAATQGPRLETAAEIKKLESDGCDIVGMTGMPEAALARELGLCYATCAVVANWAAGKAAGEITMTDIEYRLRESMTHVRVLLESVIQLTTN